MSDVSRRLRRDLLALLWKQPLWALPFTVFFAVLYARDWSELWLLFRASLVFSYCVRLGLLVVEYVILPRLALQPGEPERLRGFPVRGLWFTAGALASSYAAALIVHVWLIPSFLGSWRQAAGTGMFALLFTLVFSGIAYARAYYVQSVTRARAVEQSRAELAEAELRALRAQIHPHFLFNTLNTIAALIAENPAAAEETTTRLADVFRYTLAASERSHATLAQELAFVRDCLAIEHTRFGDRLRVEEAIEAGVESLLVPTLLLQPLVENATQHGVGARAGGGTVRLVARLEGGRLILEVGDDGPGFDPEAPARAGSFGLHSVRERLRLLGPPHALEIHRVPGGGTLARIVLPPAPLPAPRPLPPTPGDPSCRV